MALSRKRAATCFDPLQSARNLCPQLTLIINSIYIMLIEVKAITRSPLTYRQRLVIRPLLMHPSSFLSLLAQILSFSSPCHLRPRKSRQEIQTTWVGQGRKQRNGAPNQKFSPFRVICVTLQKKQNATACYLGQFSSKRQNLILSNSCLCTLCSPTYLDTPPCRLSTGTGIHLLKTVGFIQANVKRSPPIGLFPVDSLSYRNCPQSIVLQLPSNWSHCWSRKFLWGARK